MKKALLLFVVLLVYSSVFSQENQNPYFLRLEGGYASTGTGDLPGYTFEAEGGKYFTKQLKMSVGFNYARLYRNEENQLLSSATVPSIHLNFYADLLKMGPVNLEIGGGAFYRKWNWLYATGPYSTFYRTELQLPRSSYGTIDEQGVGYTISLGLNASITPRLRASFRTTYQNDTNANNLITLRPGLIFLL